ncbi:similar to Saccharomyces cerevisiae YCR036W RBK1 Putative ribokinase [Maudiozyma saulgeensis]|uniref:Ribokinase n=1 Tax=Maudiozyma saulgeensis TaxID=1789683 RepID=A0A1X7R379_9SACH|nr:similar to Saccharomyces cerevisiae YCR036W RBK1 Putative ribokinase [Kazachstania saulgeensis]
MGITVIGSLNYDLVTYTDRIPEAGETFKANSFETHTGGKGLNQTVAISKLKQVDADYKIQMVGNVGKDAFGEQLLGYLNKNNVDTSNVGTYSDVSTGVATILVEEKKSGQNRILITEGANGKTTYTDDELAKIFNNDDNDTNHMVVFQHEIPDPVSIMKWFNQYKDNYKIVYNPSPFHPLQKNDWSLFDVLVVNEIESLQIIKNIYPQNYVDKVETDIANDFIGAYSKLCEELQKNVMNPSKAAIVIITLGSQGVLFSSADDQDVQYLPAIKVEKVVDTTGAGDTFLGGVVTQLYQGNTLKQAIEFSTFASSLTIQTPGAAESIPHYPDVITSLGVNTK